jgi:hypothetical protein
MSDAKAPKKRKAIDPKVKQKLLDLFPYTCKGVAQMLTRLHPEVTGGFSSKTVERIALKLGMFTRCPGDTMPGARGRAIQYPCKRFNKIGVRLILRKVARVRHSVGWLPRTNKPFPDLDGDMRSWRKSAKEKAAEHLAAKAKADEYDLFLIGLESA